MFSGGSISNQTLTKLFMGSIFFGFVLGLVAWFLVRYLAAGFYTVNQNERAVKTCLAAPSAWARR